MDGFAQRPVQDRTDLFQETAAQMGLSAHLVEKDFWVCWTLKRLFSQGAQTGLIFKGGTSLSKAYDAIHRFSEDIDITIDRTALGIDGDKDPATVSGNARKRLLDDLDAAAQAHIQGPLRQQLETIMAGALGDPVALNVDDRNAKTLLFSYPTALRQLSQTPYIQPTIRLEFGARGAPQPAETRTINSYTAQKFPHLFTDAEFTVHTLGAERTFWEKATILHMLFHGGPDRAPGDRMSRHYYDLYMLANSAIRTKALANIDLLRTVAEHKNIFFRAAWANYAEAAPGTLRLAPHEALTKALRTDYGEMAVMIFDNPPKFDTIVETLIALEAEINAHA